ncbi:hypothetical protein, partial [Burkholderia sp. SIMBA_052]|uniref:hypothetical protein n=1 Tax=Burkholderia sp. SIMBA_052 TaxID=3085793 RepID=UPI00397A97A1
RVGRMVCLKLSVCLSLLGTVTVWFDASVALRFAEIYWSLLRFGWCGSRRLLAFDLTHWVDLLPIRVDGEPTGCI